MQRLMMKAAVTAATDLGQFEAVISSEAIDREMDIVAAGAMVSALKRWNRPIPLAWHHSTKAEDIFGSIEPKTVRAVGGEVVAQGQVHLDSEVGREALAVVQGGDDRVLVSATSLSAGRNVRAGAGTSPSSTCWRSPRPRRR
jgi:hypothetical protein